jgi:signal transduction histidine kinase
MGRLVADLQTLTKSSQPQFLTRSPVDVATLTESVRDRAAALADRDWQVAEVAHVVVDADRHRLLQAMLQLAANAAAHTRPGQPIWIGSRSEDDQVRLWVRDSGPGVDPDLAPHIFDRFVHEPDGTGAGLGLSIVEAIARAHGGRAELADPGPPGATFALVLPAQPAEDR